MFDTFFHYPRIIARHRDGPAAEERERFLEHCASTGAAQQTLAHLASELLLVARRMKARVGRISEAQSDAWFDRHRSCVGRR